MSGFGDEARERTEKAVGIGWFALKTGEGTWNFFDWEGVAAKLHGRFVRKLCRW